jgi:hypothetical protein
MRPTISEMPWNRASHLAQIGTVRQCSMPLMLAPGPARARRPTAKLTFPGDSWPMDGGLPFGESCVACRASG